MRRPLCLLLSFFLVSFLYLHQKIKVHIEAYKLTNNYRLYNQLVDKRDVLLYAFSKNVSLDKINHWAQNNQLELANGEMVLAFNNGQSQSPESEKMSGSGLLAHLNKRFLDFTGEREALAEDRE